MIKTIKCRQTKKIFDMENSTKLPKEIHQRAYIKLLMLNNAMSLHDLRIPPSNQLEKLSKDRVGQHSIRINDQWRICFKWVDGDVYDVEIVDYH